MRLARNVAARPYDRVTKAELRAHFLRELRSATARPSASPAICAALRQHPAWISARLVCAFFPLPSEPQIAPLWEGESGPQFCFPRLRDGGVELIRIDDPAHRRHATWKLDDPALAAAPLVAPAAVDLFLVPGLAFTARGVRLGRGGGYYDRLLPRRHPRSTALGLCFARQIIATLPAEPHDHDVDAVVTEEGVISEQ